MFPWVYDFKWQPAHLVFLSVFFTVVLILATLVTLAVARAVRAVRQRRVETIRWVEDFHDLPASSLVCRHEITGEVDRRSCVHGFDCRTCPEHGVFLSAALDRPDAGADPDPPGAEILGFHLPADRLYHRGHAWVHLEKDGTVTVGLDDFASRLIGKPDKVFLPKPGTRLVANGKGWRIRKGNAEACVLCPLDGDVVERGGGARGWTLRIWPAGGHLDTRHLLRGAEIRPWILREVARLQASLSPGRTGACMADGGLPVEDLFSAIPESRRDEVLGEILLEP